MNEKILNKAVSVINKYNKKKILHAKLKCKSIDANVYSLYITYNDMVHIFPDVYIEEFDRFLRKNETAICDKSFLKKSELISGLQEKEIKHIICQLDLSNIKVCVECLSKLYV